MKPATVLRLRAFGRSVSERRMALRDHDRATLRFRLHDGLTRLCLPDVGDDGVAKPDLIGETTGQ